MLPHEAMARVKKFEASWHSIQHRWSAKKRPMSDPTPRGSQAHIFQPDPLRIASASGNLDSQVCAGKSHHSCVVCLSMPVG